VIAMMRIDDSDGSFAGRRRVAALIVIATS
jgi:hypothetical protein